AITTLSDL
ncbi:Late transcription factor VLTF-4 (1), partial [Monkeypox virus]